MHSKNGDLLYFSHIPRTGGRYLRTMLVENGFIYEEAYRKLNRKNIFIDFQEPMHFRLETAKLFDDRIIHTPKLTVIRNPVTKFNSAISSNTTVKRFLGDFDCFKKLEDWGYFKHVLNEKEYSLTVSSNRKIVVYGLKHYPNNWFANQKSFFNDKFLIWKYENGLGKNLVEFIEDGIGVPIAINKVINYTRLSYDNKLPNFYLSDKIKSNVMRYYEEDYDFWESYKI
jgi:hypothetical protein